VNTRDIERIQSREASTPFTEECLGITAGSSTIGRLPQLGFFSGQGGNTRQYPIINDFQYCV
jgi:hypothetical protein